jgi:hypothetical protein
LSLLWSGVLSTVYGLLSGCAAGDRPAADPDPLLGAVSGRPAARTSTPTPAATLSAPAPLPAPSSSTSTAALAPGAFTPLDPTHDLRIGAGGGSATGAAGDAWHGRTGAPDVALRQPEPTNGGATPRAVLPVSASGPAPAPVTTAAGSVTTFEQAQVLLKAHGVVWQRLETWGEGGEWKFSCSVPNRQNPNLRQNYEARAGDQLAAVRAVLEQIEREQR